MNVGGKKYTFLKTAWRQRYLYLMSVPFMALVFLFNYVPIWGWTMAFQNYKPALSFFEQEWVGMKWFAELWVDKRFWLAFRNTVAMGGMGIVAGFFLPIILALLLNELRVKRFKKVVQTVTYLPHFVSWVVVASIFLNLLSLDGIVNTVLVKLGVISEPELWMVKPKLFWWIITISTAWKETGWSSIIYLAAIAGVDQELYEAAVMDGCKRFRRMWHITLPGISSTIVVLLIMSIGNLTRIGFERQMLLGNALVTDYSEVIDLYVLKYGLGTMRFSFGTAIGVFNSLIAVTLMLIANGASRKTRGEGVF